MNNELKEDLTARIEEELVLALEEVMNKEDLYVVAVKHVVLFKESKRDLSSFTIQVEQMKSELTDLGFIDSAFVPWPMLMTELVERIELE